MKNGNRNIQESIDDSLLHRLGGEENRELTILQFYKLIKEDPQLDPFFADTDIKLLRAHQKRFMIVAFTHIPEDFDVASFIVQRHYRLFQMGLNETHFDLVANHLVTALRQMWVEQEEINEVLAILGPFREVFQKTASSRAIKIAVAQHKVKQQRRQQRNDKVAAAVATMKQTTTSQASLQEEETRNSSKDKSSGSAHRRSRFRLPMIFGKRQEKNVV